MPHTSPQEQEYNYHQLWHLLLKMCFTLFCHESPPTVPTASLPKLSLSTFSHWVWERSLVVFPDMSLLIQNPDLIPKDIAPGPTGYPLQGTLWIANCSRALHLLRYAHHSSSQGPGPVAAASCKFFGSETAQLVQGNHSLVGATYNPHF